MIVTGHSKGGVLAQYFIADYAGELSDKVIDLTVFGSPNAGSEFFIKTWAAAPNLRRAKFYTTYGKYSRFLASTLTIHDIITWKEVDLDRYDVFMAIPELFGFDMDKYYPRGLSRSTDKYVTDYAFNLHRQKIKASSGSYTDDVIRELYAQRIHDDSYYISALKKASDKGELDKIKPTDGKVMGQYTAVTQVQSWEDSNGAGAQVELTYQTIGASSVTLYHEVWQGSQYFGTFEASETISNLSPGHYRIFLKDSPDKLLSPLSLAQVTTLVTLDDVSLVIEAHTIKDNL